MQADTMNAEPMTPVITEHGEGSGWHPDEQVFKVVDLSQGDLVTLDQNAEDGVRSRQHLGPVAAAWRPRHRGGVVVAVERGFLLLDADGKEQDRVEAWTDPDVRMNDGACDPQGRFYCGSMAYDESTGAGSLWRLDTDGSVHEVLTDLSIANGLIWSQDGTGAFHIDTPTGRVDHYRFDAQAGTLHDRRTVVEVSGGSPDGMTMDAEGALWVAIWGGGAVHRYLPTGELSAVVSVDAQQVSSCAFGGPDMDQLIITTSRQGLGPDDDPLAGSIFTVRPGVRGIELLGFAG